MLKKKLAVVLSLCLALTYGMSTVAMAATVTSPTIVSSPITPGSQLNPVQLANIRQIISAQLSELNNKQLIQFNGASGMLYDLNLIVNKSMWIDYMTEYKTAYKYSSSAISYQTNLLIKQIKEFNTEYGKGLLPGNSTNGISTNGNSDGGYYPASMIVDYLVSNSPNMQKNSSQLGVHDYSNTEKGQTINCQGILEDSTIILSNYMEMVNAQIKGVPSSNNYSKYFSKSNLNNEEVVSNNKEPLVLIYNMLKDVNKNFLQIQNSIPDSFSKSGGGLVTGKAIWQNKPYIGTLSYIIDNKTNYNLLQQAVNMNVNSIVSLSGGMISAQQNLLQNFYQNANTETGSLKNFYWKLFSCSSVYVPLVSHLNSQNFRTAFSSISPTNSEQYLNFYSSTINFLKPLYIRKINNSGKAVGTATMATLGDLQKDVQSGTDGALVMVKGTLHVQPNTNTYVYYNQDRFAGTGAQNNDTAVGKTSGSKSSDNENTKTSTLDNSDSNSGNSDTSGKDSNKKSDSTKKTNTDTNKKSDSSGTKPDSSKSNDNKTKPDVKTTDTKGKSPDVKTVPATASISVVNHILLADPSNSSSSGGSGNFTVSNNGESTGIKNSGSSSLGSTTAQGTPNGSNMQESTGSKSGMTFNSIRTNSNYTLLNNVSNDNDLTSPVFKWTCATGPSGQASLGLVLAGNILDNAKLSKSQKSEILYMDAYGDIVTANNLVIIPGSSNPTLLNEKQSYYPYTDAFMSTYPSLINGQVGMATSSAAKNKYVVYMEDNSVKTWVNKSTDIVNDYYNGKDYIQNIVRNIVGLQGDDKGNVSNNHSGNKKQASNVSNSAFNLQTLNNGNSFTMNNSTQLYSRELDSNNSLKYSADNEMSRPIFLRTKGIGLSGASGLQFQYISSATPDFTSGLPLFLINKMGIFRSSNSTQPIQLFPSTPTQANKDGLAMISEQYLWSLFCNQNGTTGKTPNGRINQNLIARFIVPQALNGSANPQAFEKNQLNNLSNYEKNQGWFSEQKIIQLASPMINKINMQEGVLGLQSAYNNIVIRKIINISHEYVWYIIAFLVVMCVARYLAFRSNALYSITVSVLAIVVGIVFLRVIPVYLPTVYNVATNDLSRNLTYESLMMSAENYNTFYKPTTERGGKIVFNGPSVNLYKADTTQYNYILTKLGLPTTGLLINTNYIINGQSGQYLVGNQIEENIEKLFQSYPVTGKYTNTPTGMAFQYSGVKEVGSNIGYYCPYYLFANSLIQRLNTFSDTFKLVQHQYHYGGITKGAFVVNDYINSALMLYPKTYLKYMWYLTPQQKQIVTNTFKDNSDPFGVSTIFYGQHTQDYTTAMQNSLWYQTMLQNGVTPNNGNLVRVLAGVTLDTRQFVAEHSDTLAQMSDANAIKVIALYETMMFDQKISSPDNYVYPLFINYSNLNLGTILLSTFVTNSTMFESQNMQIVPYIAYTYSWFTLIIFIILDIISFVVVAILQLLIPIFYIYLGFLLVINFVVAGKIGKLMIGFAKTSGYLFALMTINVFALNIAHGLNGSVFAFWFLLIVESMILETLFRLIFFGIFKDFLHMGANSIGTNTLPWLMRKAVKLLSVSSLIAGSYTMGKETSRMPSKAYDVYKKYKVDNYMDYNYNAPSNVGNVIKRYKGRPTEGYMDKSTGVNHSPTDTTIKGSEEYNLKRKQQSDAGNYTDPLDSPYINDTED